MATAIKISVTGTRQLLADIKRLKEKIQKEVNGEVVAAGQEYVKRAKQTLSSNRRGNDEGTLLQSINYEVVKPGIVTVQAQAAHALYIEFGTKGRYKPIPGIDASQFRQSSAKGGSGFYDAILRWVKRKKIAGSYSRGTYSVKTKREIRKRLGTKVDQQIEDEQTAFAIYLSIIRHGISPSPFFFQHQKGIKEFLTQNIQRVVNSARL